MKKIIRTIILSFALMIVASCNTKSIDYIIKNEPSIIGVVTSIEEKSFIVECNDGKYVVPKEVENKDSYSDYSIGDEIIVYYDGNVAETYPMRIMKVYTICLNNKK